MGTEHWAKALRQRLVFFLFLYFLAKARGPLSLETEYLESCSKCNHRSIPGRSCKAC